MENAMKVTGIEQQLHHVLRQCAGLQANKHASQDNYAFTAVFGNLPSTITQRDAEAWLKEKLHNICSIEPEIFCKGDFKGIMFAKFRSTDARDHAVQEFSKARLSHGMNEIWCNKDRPVPVRCQLGFLFAVKKMLASWQFKALWVEEDDFALY